jgi:hypothetical protein
VFASPLRVASTESVRSSPCEPRRREGREGWTDFRYLAAFASSRFNLVTAEHSGRYSRRVTARVVLRHSLSFVCASIDLFGESVFVGTAIGE